MAQLDFLDAVHEVYRQNETAWKREERRLFGGDAVVENTTDFPQFRNETADHFASRKAQASYLNFPSIHAKILAGHMGRVAPMPNYGFLGEVRKRAEVPKGRETFAELFHYNCDGVGADGTQFRAWATGVQERAIATGLRWTMVEMPVRAAGASERVSEEEYRAGQRPFVVEYSPLSVPYWEYTNGRLDWCVIRCPVGRSGVVNGVWMPAPTRNQLGYYLLVRQGYTGLGNEYAGGGWWLFDSDRREQARGDWSRTKGQIPFFPLIAESSAGTVEVPAIARSLTMELGQIAVSLMNRISERNFDASDAAKSVKYVLGADKDGFNLMVEHHEQNSILVPVVGSVTSDGKIQVPQIYDGSSGAVAAEVFSTIIAATITEAHEVMVRQLTSEADSSGRSKEVGFGEATSPLLVSLIDRRETWENNIIHFVELRAGATTPQGLSEWTREIEIAPLVAKIDRTIERMLKVGARSPTLESRMIQNAAMDDGLWPKEEAESRKAASELTESLTLSGKKEKAAIFDTLAKSGSRIGAAKIAGYTAGEIRALDDVEEPEPVVPGGNGTGMIPNNGNGAAPVGSR